MEWKWKLYVHLLRYFLIGRRHALLPFSPSGWKVDMMTRTGAVTLDMRWLGQCRLRYYSNKIEGTWVSDILKWHTEYGLLTSELKLVSESYKCMCIMHWEQRSRNDCFMVPSVIIQLLLSSLAYTLINGYKILMAYSITVLCIVQYWKHCGILKTITCERGW